MERFLKDDRRSCENEVDRLVMMDEEKGERNCRGGFRRGYLRVDPSRGEGATLQRSERAMGAQEKNRQSHAVDRSGLRLAAILQHRPDQACHGERTDGGSNIYTAYNKGHDSDRGLPTLQVPKLDQINTSSISTHQKHQLLNTITELQISPSSPSSYKQSPYTDKTTSNTSTTSPLDPPARYHTSQSASARLYTTPSGSDCVLSKFSTRYQTQSTPSRTDFFVPYTAHRFRLLFGATDQG